MNNSIGGEAKRREKHIEIHDAIQQMDSIILQLDELIHRMEGPVMQSVEPAAECSEAVKESLPHFMDVLNGGAGVIREKTESAHKRINRLNELLFE